MSRKNTEKFNRNGSIILAVLLTLLLIFGVITIISKSKMAQEYSIGNTKRAQNVKTVLMNAVYYTAGKLGKDELQCVPSPCSTGSKIILPSYGNVKLSGIIEQKFTKNGDDYYLIKITAVDKNVNRTVEFLYRK